MKHFLWILLLLSPAWLKTCIGSNTDSLRTPVLEVSGITLYMDELQASLPENLTKEDSVRLSQLYIENWIKDVLLYQAAQKNLKEDSKITAMVENYRRSLIIYEYQQQALNEKMKEEVSDDDIRSYYDENAERFLSSHNLIHGIFIKASLDAHNLLRIKSLYKKTDEKSLEELEALCFQNAATYDYFMDKWISLNDIMDLIPYEIKDQGKFLKSQNALEIEDEHYCYLLYINDYIPAGNPEPLEFVSQQIRNILINSQKTDFIHQFESQMVEEAKQKGKITYYIPSRDSISQ